MESLNEKQVQELREYLQANEKLSLSRLTIPEIACSYAMKFGVSVGLIHGVLFELVFEKRDR